MSSYRSAATAPRPVELMSLVGRRLRRVLTAAAGRRCRFVVPTVVVKIARFGGGGRPGVRRWRIIVLLLGQLSVAVVRVVAKLVPEATDIVVFSAETTVTLPVQIFAGGTAIFVRTNGFGYRRLDRGCKLKLNKTIFKIQSRTVV